MKRRALLFLAVVVSVDGCLALVVLGAFGAPG